MTPRLNSNISRLSRSPSLWKRIGSIGTAITLAVGIIAAWDHIDPLLFPDGNILNIRSYLLSLFILLLVAFLVTRWRVDVSNQTIEKLEIQQQESSEKLENQQREFDLRMLNLRNQLRDLERERLLDVITGIPNQEMLKLDIEKYVSEPDQQRKYQFVLIDLDNFGSINKKYGFLKGDEVIRLIAQSIYANTRRNEDMYKKSPISFPYQNQLQSRMYRSYKGGDEFLFILRGYQYEAVGFLNRLQDRMDELSNLTRGILGDTFQITFHGAVAQIFQGDSYKQAFKRVQDVYIGAVEHRMGLKVAWIDTEEKNDLSLPDSQSRSAAVRFYAIARDRFKADDPQRLPEGA